MSEANGYCYLCPRFCQPRRAQSFAGRNPQRSTLQTPQGLDATHRDELFPVKREYIGINSGVRRACRGRQKFALRTSEPRAIFQFGIRNFCVRRCSNGFLDITPFKFAMRDRRDIRDICPACPGSERDGQDKGYVIALSCPARRSLFSARDRRRTAAEPGSHCQVAEHGSV
jgi:hypothetical protein